jgi:hypothetical protein
MFHRNELREEKRIASVTSHQYAGELGILGNDWNKMAGTKSATSSGARMLSEIRKVRERTEHRNRADMRSD